MLDQENNELKLPKSLTLSLWAIAGLFLNFATPLIGPITA